MSVKAEYGERMARNRGFVTDDAQQKIRGARVLVAGCGLGSVIAELLARTGFTELVVADGDQVELHNLNRQCFGYADIGENKAERLAQRLRAIHPEVHAEAAPFMLNRKNIPELVERVDAVVDSIDFLDATAILALHREARRQHKPVISPIAAGWGSAALVFHPDGSSIYDLVGLAEGEIPDGVAYSALFLEALSRLGEALPAYVAEVVRDQLEQIRERRPCPISQLGAGTYSAASLTVTLLVRILLGESVPLAPSLIVIDPLQVFREAVTV